MYTKRLFLTSLIGGALGSSIQAMAGDPGLSTPPPGHVEGNLPSLEGATAWLNSRPLSETDLRGKVVLIDFWTYTCINWLRTLPYVRAWDAKYRKHGLVTIGVHTPEFGFEKDVGNVRRAVSAMGVDYPVAIDSNAAIWRAFGNEFWPALYFVDAKGRIRHHRFGEGDEQSSAQVIRQLLSEAGANDLGPAFASVVAHGIEAAADSANLKSAENYVGYLRTEQFASSGGIVRDKASVYTAPARLSLNAWSLAGNWTMFDSFATLNNTGGRMLYQFHARDLHLVMAPAAVGKPVRFRVLVDGQPPRQDHGLDVDDSGVGIAVEARLYQLIRQRGRLVDRRFEIEFLDAHVQIYAITFG